MNFSAPPSGYGGPTEFANAMLNERPYNGNTIEPPRQFG